MASSKRRPIIKPSSPKRRVKVTEYDEEPQEREDDLDGLDIDADEESIRSVLSQFGASGEVEVKVYRITPTGKEYCYTDGPGVTEESIKQGPYGANGGKFLLHVMIDGQLRRSFPVNIAAPLHAPGSQNGGTSDAVVKAIERLEARLSQAPAEPMSQVLTAVVGLINNQNQRPPETSLDQFLKIAEFVQRGRGGDDDDSFTGILKSVAKEVAPVILPGLMRGGGNRPAVADEPEVGMEEQELRQAIAYLKKKCMIGSDPALYLDFILDNAEDARFAKLIQLAATQPFEIFTTIDPELAQPPYLAYFKFIYDGLRSAFESANKVDVDSGRPGGDKPDSTENGATRKGGAK